MLRLSEVIQTQVRSAPQYGAERTLCLPEKPKKRAIIVENKYVIYRYLIIY